MKPDEAGKRAGNGTDAALRSTLAPDAATVDRLVREALAERPAPRLSWGAWRLTAAAAVLILAAISFRLLAPDPPPVTPGPRAGGATSSTEPVAVSIHNEGGFVTVVTAAGSKMILLPEETP